MVGGCVDGSVARIADRVEDAPAAEQRALGLPPAALVVAPEHEQPLPCAHESQDLDLTILARTACRRDGESDTEPIRLIRSIRAVVTH
jgi:hypothetical protein